MSRNSKGRNSREHHLQRRRNAKRARAKRKIRLILLFVVLVIIGCGAFLYKKYSPSNEKMDLNKYYGVADGEMAIVINQQMIEAKGICENGKAYIDYSTVKEYLNDRFYWDSNENLLLYTLPEETVSVETGATGYTVAKEEKTTDYVILKADAQTSYIAVDFLQQYTNLTFEVFENPDRVVITHDQSTQDIANIRKDTQVRYRAGIKSRVLKELAKGDSVVVLDEQDVSGWTKVCTEDGLVGYVKNNAIKSTETKTLETVYQDPEYTSISSDSKINLAWHQVTSMEANTSDLAKIASAKGITTVAPTWFSLKDENGTLASLASADYVTYAHKMGLGVWAVVDNFTYDVDTTKMLTFTSLRQNFEKQLIAAVLGCGADGINIDFEQLTAEDGDGFIQFVRELSVQCRKNGIVLSVDNYVPGYTDYYNRKEQGVVADYVIIMGYDEHYSGSEEAGSVASIDYVKTGIEDTIQDVPENKVINALPFYTRLWKEEGGKVTCEATYGMTAAANALEVNGAEASWDEETGQNYAQWQSGDAVYKIWLEDAQSIQKKLDVMSEYNLAGVAAWKLGLETSDIWDVILKYVN
jgi:spore germination protein YaaH